MNKDTSVKTSKDSEQPKSQEQTSNVRPQPDIKKVLKPEILNI
jgi:hypothetical protein